MRPRFVSLTVLVLAFVVRPIFADWSDDQIAKLPAGEKAVHLFNGKDLSGWEGHTGKYFNVENGIIVGKNGEQNAPKSSTYLLTTKKYRNFRLICESKLVTSEMHSGISLWGKKVEKDEGPFTYQGHLVMYPSGYGYYDLFRRNSIYQDTLGVAKRVGKQHDWNQMEILAIGRRIRHVINGYLVADWSDPQPELCEEGPIGLQLHSNKVAQEVQWRGLVLTENPQDKLVTVVSRDAGLIVEGKPTESGMDADSLKKIDEQMKAFAEAKQISGAVTLIARRGRIVHVGATGKADIAGNRDMTKDTLFAIASMTKPITAAAVMIAQEDGKLKLDDPVSKYIPAFQETMVKDPKGPRKPNREITIRDCLKHTNGLDYEQRNMGTLEETANKFAAVPLSFEPGSKWLYGPGLSVAGRVLEVATGKSFEEFLSERIFKPLDMNETTFRLTPEQREKRMAKLYQPNKEKTDLEPGEHWLFSDSPSDIPNPSGGLYSTASDLVRFYQMVLNGGELNGKRVLSADSAKQMTSLQSGELATVALGVGWGLGFSVVPYPRAGNVSLSPYSYGHGGAFGTQGWIDPQQEMIFVLMIARQNFSAPHAADIRAALQKLAVEAVKD